MVDINGVYFTWQWVDPHDKNFSDNIKEICHNDPALIKQILESQQKKLPEDYEQSCMHDSCPKCHGTGISIHGGMCFHNLSCNCPKCSWR